MSDFELAVSNGVALLKITRSEKRNALTDEMTENLQVLCREIERNDKIQLVILSGENTAFCAGGDIDAWSALSSSDFGRHWVRNGHQALDAFARLRQPVIAVLNGHALGGGLELAACADYRIAEAHIRIGQPETGLGIIPGWSGTQRAVRRFGSQLVRRMALFGEVFDAEQAAMLGLVDQVVAKGEGLTAACALAEKLRHRGPAATELVKMLVNAAEGEERERVCEAMAGQLAATHPELQTGLTAFRERRKADFWPDEPGEKP